MTGTGSLPKQIATLVLGAGAIFFSTTASAATTWELVHSEMNNGNVIASLSALSPTMAWAVGITTQGSNQTPAAWRTTNGTGWTQIPLPPGGGGTFEFTIPTQIAFVDENAGWLAGVRASPAIGQLNLIWRTTSGGMSWDELHGTSDEIQQIQVTSDWSMFAVGGSTVVRTLDGATFSETQPPIPSGLELSGVHMFSKDCGYILASTPLDSSSLASAVFWTSDGGDNWEIRSENRDYRLRRAWFVSSELGWAVGHRKLEGVLAKTVDGGRTWTTSKAPDHPPFFNQTPPVTSCEDVRFFDDMRGVALCLCCTGGCEGGEEDSPSFLTSFLRTSDGGSTWEMDPDYEEKMSAPPFPQMSKASGMRTMSFPDPNNGFMAGENNLILRYTADNPEPEGWPPPSCPEPGTGGGSSGGTGGSSTNGSSGAQSGQDSDSGCGCRVGIGSPNRTHWIFLLGVVAAMVRRGSRTREGCSDL